MPVNKHERVGGISMRYNMIRKYPITAMKKNKKCNDQESYIDMSIGTAAAITGLIFVSGLMLGYVIKGCRR